MKQVLMLASVASMIDQFNMSNIEILQSMGYKVEVACNFIEGNACSDEKISDLKKRLEKMGVPYYQIDFSRSGANIRRHLKAYRQVKNLLDKNQYEFLHCHSPIGGAIGRIAGKRTGTKVIYTAHGFHFFKGAPIKNWLVFYPVEKFLSRWTDILITINQEDYQRAKEHFHMKKLEYIPGVGVDIERFSAHQVSKEEKRNELGIPLDAFVLLSVGELSDRKNHQVVIKALGEMQDDSIYYVIAGNGELYNAYQEIAKSCGVENNVVLLGPRTDVDELCDMADVFVHPSVREGLGIAPLEAMAAGLPLISTYINGIKDYTEDGVTGCCIEDPKDIEKMKDAILKMKDDPEFRTKCSNSNMEAVKRFDITKTEEVMVQIYGGGYSHLRILVKRLELDVPDDMIWVLSVGELIKRKNHETLIRTVAQLNQIYLTIVGQGELREYLSNLIIEMGLENRVKLLGFRTDVSELCLAADLFAFPSFREGLSLALMEAMASGKPVVCSRIRGNTDLVDEGKGGFFFNPNSVGEIVQALQKLNMENMVAMGEYNAHKITSFSKQVVDKKMREIYANQNI